MPMKTITKELKNKKVILGLSGGVDSTTAALLLMDKGLEVTGLYFDVAPENLHGRLDAEKAAFQMNIPLIYKNVIQEFDQSVISNFCNEYEEGRTPNPCIICNPNIKFKLLLDTANELGADYIATGHYAKVEDSQLYVAANKLKDQSYMLYRLTDDVLERLILPLGNIDSKDQVRSFARKHQMENAEKKDSQEICFVQSENGSYLNYLEQRGLKSQPGSFIDINNHILGQHQGLIHYTIGQRKGLGMTFGKPMYVISMDPVRNTVMLGDNEDLMRSIVTSHDHVILGKKTDCIPYRFTERMLAAKIRYTAKPAEATIQPLTDGKIATRFVQPQRAATPGQSIVFYDGDHLIGGGFIE